MKRLLSNISQSNLAAFLAVPLATTLLFIGSAGAARPTPTPSPSTATVVVCHWVGNHYQLQNVNENALGAFTAPDIIDPPGGVCPEGTPTPSSTPTATPTPTPTPTPSLTPTPTPTPSEVAVSTVTICHWTGDGYQTLNVNTNATGAFFTNGEPNNGLDILNPEGGVCPEGTPTPSATPTPSDTPTPSPTPTTEVTSTVIICHWTGAEFYQKLTVNENAIGGFFNEDNTPKNGVDVLNPPDGVCPETTPTPSPTPTPGSGGGGPATLTGFVYVDSNQNGFFDPTENGVANIELTLSGESDDIVFSGGALIATAFSATTTSGTGGLFTFANVPPGTYAISPSYPPSCGANGLGSGGSLGGTYSSGNIIVIPVGATQVGTGYNFGVSCGVGGGLGPTFSLASIVTTSGLPITGGDLRLLMLTILIVATAWYVPQTYARFVDIYSNLR